MRIYPFIYEDIDDLYANTYLVADEDNNCVVIDPSKDNDGIINFIKKNGLNLKGVLLTHGHFDHIRGVKRLVDAFSIPVYIGFEDESFLIDPYLNCSRSMSEDYVLHIKAETISDNDVLKMLKEVIICIHTPMHTIGSYCFYLKDSGVLFTGDFLFKGSVGRWDLPTGSIKTLKSSMNKLLVLPDNTKIYPGHGPSTNIKLEKQSNYYFCK